MNLEYEEVTLDLFYNSRVVLDEICPHMPGHYVGHIYLGIMLAAYAWASSWPHIPELHVVLRNKPVCRVDTWESNSGFKLPYLLLPDEEDSKLY